MNRQYLRLMSPLWAAAATLYIFYAWVTFSGLWRWLAELQVGLFGAYSLNMTMVALLVVVIVPAALLRRWFGGPTPPAGRPLTAMPRARPRTLALIGVGLLVVAVGAGGLGYRKSQERVEFERLDLSHYQPPASTHVELTGLAHPGMSVTRPHSTNGSSIKSTYLPVTGRDWRRDQPITHFLKPAEPIGGDAPIEISLRGVLVRDDLPGIVAAEYEKHGLTLASPLYILDTKADADYAAYGIVAMGAVVAALLCLVMSVVVRVQSWRTQRAGQT